MKKHRHVVGLGVLVIVAGIFFSIPKFTTHQAAKTPPPPYHNDFREISKIDTTLKIAVITIDAGFGSRSADGLLKALQKHHIKATFFLVGQWIEKYPDLAIRIYNEGHEIFNHSYSHPDYTTWTPDQIKADLQKMDDVLVKTVGIHSQPYFRAPSGYRNKMVKQAAAELGYQHVYWDIDPQDWRLDISGAQITNAVVSRIHPGAIILLHIADSATGDIADELFTELEKKGYKLISLTEALKMRRTL